MAGESPPIPCAHPRLRRSYGEAVEDALDERYFGQLRINGGWVILADLASRVVHHTLLQAARRIGSPGEPVCERGFTLTPSTRVSSGDTRDCARFRPFSGQNPEAHQFGC